MRSRVGRCLRRILPSQGLPLTWSQPANRPPHSPLDTVAPRENATPSRSGGTYRLSGLCTILDVAGIDVAVTVDHFSARSATPLSLAEYRPPVE